MIDDITDIQRHYDANPGDEHDRLLRHQLEYEITVELLKRYLPGTGKILEIGPASGRYTVELAKWGHAIVAVDLSPAMIAACTRNVSAAGFSDQLTAHVADARDLRVLGDTRFDAALVMGPLYHLVYEADRKIVLRQVFERLAPGGIVFSALISRYGILGDLMKSIPDWIERREEVRTVLKYGRDTVENTQRTGFRGYFSDVTEIVPLHEEFGFETVELAAVEPAISADDESYNRLEGDQRRLWLELLLKIRTNPTSVGASRHLLYIGRKP